MRTTNSTPATINFNVSLAVKAGIKASIIYSFLSQCIECPNQEWICAPEKLIERMTTLTRKEQDNAIKKLKALGLIETKLKGIPAKKHFKIL